MFILVDIELENKLKVIADMVVGSIAEQLDSARLDAAMVAQGLNEMTAEVVATAKSQLKESLGGMLEFLKAATQGINESTVKISETFTKYRDALL